MRIAVAREADPTEDRVAATPETVKKMKALGADVAVEPGAGIKSGIPDADFAGGGRDRVRRMPSRMPTSCSRCAGPTPPSLPRCKKGALVIAIMDPYGNEAALKTMADAGVTAFAMELMPRITRAQVMDVLSSQANLAGYRAVIDAAAEYGRALPMMMTAAGTIPAAKVFVMGAGVAGLQAIATARRLGAIVTATDVRPAAKEQVESLGAKFVAVEDDEFKQAETAAGYAKEMSKEYQAKQAALVAEHVKKQDIVITTALIPGRPAPRLISKEMVRVHAAGLGDRRSCGRARRQCRAGQARRGRSRPTASRSSAISTLRAASRPRPRASTPRICMRFLEILVDKQSQGAGGEVG